MDPGKLNDELKMNFEKMIREYKSHSPLRNSKIDSF